MRYRLFIFFTLIITTPLLSSAQSKELLQRIALSETMRRLDYEQKYDSIILLSKKFKPLTHLDLYSNNETVAIAYFEKGNTAMGLKYMRVSVIQQEANSPDNLQYIYKKYKLDSNAAYKNILANFDKLHNYYGKDMNVPMLAECMQIFYTNIQVRYLCDLITDSTEKKYADKYMWQSDSMNVVQVKELLRKEGRFPGISDIGISFMSSFNYIFTHIASHIDHDTLYNYLRTATLKGEIPNWFATRMLDKLEFDRGKPYIYGEMGFDTDYAADGTYIYPPITDIEHVDKRRAEFLLPPLYKEQYVQKCVLPKGYDPKTQKGQRGD